MNRIIPIVARFLLLIALLLSAIPMRSASALGTIRYATPGGLTSGSCTSWAAACKLRYVMNSVAVSGDQVWVSQGIHTPNPAYQTDYLRLYDGVKVYGGFLGSETRLGQRNFVANTTILSGDIGTPNFAFDNSHRVVLSSLATSSAVLDGFTITGANSFGSGGGMYNNLSSPTLSNLVFLNNSADTGGGMYNDSSSPTLVNVQFNGNNAGFGGGMMNGAGSFPRLKRVTFVSNQADTAGGGMYNSISSPILNDVTFRFNYAGSDGGGMYNNGSSPTLNKVTFKGNSAAIRGGGLYNMGASNSTLVRVTFSSNHAGDGGGGMFNDASSPVLDMVNFNGNVGMEFGGGMVNWNASMQVKNSSFTDNWAKMWGGGIYNGGSSSLQLAGTTFSANSAIYEGGGIYNFNSSAAITNSTFHGNTANAGGAVNNYNGTLTLDFTTLSGNTGFVIGGAYYNGGGQVDVRSSILWNNGLIETASINGGSATMIRTILKGGCALDPSISTCTKVSTKNPLLKPLAKNGGFTRTMALPFGSPAIDTGMCIPGINKDQRGISRPQNGKCDIGSYEFVP